MQTQNAMILAHLRAGYSLTPLESMEKFGTLRLGARIYDLRRAGAPISAERITLAGNRTVARSRLTQKIAAIDGIA